MADRVVGKCIAASRVTKLRSSEQRKTFCEKLLMKWEFETQEFLVSNLKACAKPSKFSENGNYSRL